MKEVVTPYGEESGKKEQVEKMFNNISHRYDFLNQLLSLGIHHSWRKKAVKIFQEKRPEFILDIATGTADFAIEALKSKPKKIIGIDISEGMLEFGRKKIRERNLESVIELKKGDAENMEFSEECFDVITVAFGVRNFEDLEKGLRNMHKVLKTGGDVIILEFSKPKGLFRYVYNFYFRFITPVIGKIFSKDNSAYSYLPASVSAFPDRENFVRIMEKCGFKKSQYKSLTFGVASIYSGTK
jgi:demethylmenaquinone methyltransferase/2-methoxy-6-polyprenyl-1,4-benzoquinol methylase